MGALFLLDEEVDDKGGNYGRCPGDQDYVVLCVRRVVDVNKSLVLLDQILSIFYQAVNNILVLFFHPFVEFFLTLKLFLVILILSPEVCKSLLTQHIVSIIIPSDLLCVCCRVHGEHHQQQEAACHEILLCGLHYPRLSPLVSLLLAR